MPPPADHTTIPLPLVPGPHIRRRDDTHGRGWLVRIVRKYFRQERMFSDGPHGGAAQALAAAQQWRDAQHWYRGPSAGPIAVPDAAFAASLGRSLPAPPAPLSSGAPLLVRYTSMVMIQGHERLCTFWWVSWTDAKGRAWVRKFSVNFWGEETAHQKALRIYTHQQHQMNERQSNRAAKAAKPTTQR